MTFLNKVEAAILKYQKKSKQKARPNLLVKKARSLKEKDIKSAPAHAAKVSFANLTQTRKLIPAIEKELGKTDPFYFDNVTWDRFLKHIAPQLFIALLLDMKIVPFSKKAEFVRHMNRVLMKVKG